MYFSCHLFSQRIHQVNAERDVKDYIFELERFCENRVGTKSLWLCHKPRHGIFPGLRFLINFWLSNLSKKLILVFTLSRSWWRGWYIITELIDRLSFIRLYYLSFSRSSLQSQPLVLGQSHRQWTMVTFQHHDHSSFYPATGPLPWTARTNLPLLARHHHWADNTVLNRYQHHNDQAKMMGLIHPVFILPGFIQPGMIVTRWGLGSIACWRVKR